MGHYRGEMHLDDKSSNEPAKPNNNYIVTSDFRVVTVDEFDVEFLMQRSSAGLLSNPLLYRSHKTEFAERHDAENHARELCEAAVERIRQDLLTMKNVLKVKRPWEKK